MDSKLSIELINSMVLTMALVGGMLLIVLYLKDRKRQRVLEEEKFKLEKERLRADMQKYDSELIKQTNSEAMNEASNFNPGGYIVLELPDNLRSMFTDLLKGFEDYAKLKGYSISFSVDNSISNKIAFKFTIQDFGIHVSTQTVRKDIQEYIDKVKNEESFDDMPIIISPEEHALVSTTLKNRMNFLQHNYNLEKNTRQYYENLLNKVSASPLAFAQQPAIFIQTGGVNSQKHLSSNNSSNLLIGDDVQYENNSDYSNHTKVNIENSFNKKKEQIDKLHELIELVKREKNIEAEAKQTIINNLDKTREEIQEEENPDKSKVYRWMTKAKKMMEAFVLSHDTAQAVEWVYKSLNIFSELFK